MEKRLKAKMLFFALLLTVVSTLVFGEILVSYHIGHECAIIETNCLICVKISVFKILLKTLKTASFGFCLAALLLCFTRDKLKYLEPFFYKLSPVFLKVRLNS